MEDYGAVGDDRGQNLTSDYRKGRGSLTTLFYHDSRVAILPVQDRSPQRNCTLSHDFGANCVVRKRHVTCGCRDANIERGTDHQQGRLAMTLTAAGNPLVLVVEDHDDTREMLQLLLGGFGCRVVGAANGYDGMSIAEEILPDLILMDMKMPRLDGLAVTRMIRSHPTLKDVPILAVTGIATPQFHSEALSAGCNY